MSRTTPDSRLHLRLGAGARIEQVAYGVAWNLARVRDTDPDQPRGLH